MLAEYECVRCGHEWREKPGAVSCLVCNPQLRVDAGAKLKHHYVEWTNYEEMRINRFK